MSSKMKTYICSVVDCGKPGLGRCSQCKVRYCGEECQADDWPSHMRFCLPLPALEFPDSGSGLSGNEQIIDINNTTHSGNTVLAGEVCVEEIQLAKTVTTAKKKEENNNTTPAPKEEPAKVPEEAVAPSIQETGDGSGSPQLEEKKPVAGPDSVSAQQGKEAVSSPQMEAQKVPEGLQDIDPIDVTQIVSPAEFSISLAAEGEHYVQLITLMNDKAPALDSSWSVGRKEPVLALHETLWQRGLAVKKKGQQDFLVFLLDAGLSVTVNKENLRSLSQELRQVPPFIYQVCLADIKPKEDGRFTEEEIIAFQTILTDPSYPLVVEFLGQLPGGRWLVRMQGKEDGEDVAKFLVQNVGFAAGENPPVTAPTFTEKPVQLPVPVKVELVKGPTIGLTMELEEGCEGTVKSLESPTSVYILPISRQELFLSIMERLQAATLQGEVDPVLGTACVAKDPEDGLNYRVEILEVDKEDGKAALFQIDHGKVMMEDIKMLKPLPEDLAQVAGLLTKVSIRGMKLLENWSVEQEDVAKIVMDVGGSTIFRFTELKHVGPKLFVNARDTEGNDLASFLLDAGLPAENGFDRTSLVPVVLKAGKQELVVLTCLSPLEIYVSSEDAVLTFNETGTVAINKIGETADFVHLPKVGQLVLVYKEDSWYRAEVMEGLLANGNILVNLIDLPEVFEVEKSQLRQAPESFLKFPVLAVKCGLDCFYGKDEEASKHVEKLKALGMDFQFLEGEVLGSQDGLTRVRIPAIESKLEPVTTAKSSREALLKKLMKK